MLRTILFGLCAGSALQAWRQFPPDGPLTADSALWLALSAVVIALGVGWGLGRGHRGGATAVASAHSEATAAALGNQVHVNVFSRDLEGARPVGLTVPDSPSWRGEAPVLSSDQVAELLSEGADLAELGLEETSVEEVRG